MKPPSGPANELPDQPHTIARGGGRKWIYPVEIDGRWTRLRAFVLISLIALFFAAPWLQLNGKPLVLLSVMQGSFIILGQTILMREFYHFVLLFLLLVTTLFAASALLGRIWCGYACPQTIFIEQIFLRIERLIEGPALRRRANDLKPWKPDRASFMRAGKKLVKHALFLSVCIGFSLTLVAFFVGSERAFWPRESSVLWPVGILTLLAWLDGAWWREQICHIACPYGRFQGLMQDKATRTIGYDAIRGEPRRRGKAREGAGDCIDCGLCERVCPSGIDIRQGASQIECIGCARCIDACDSIMTSVGKPKGLIRYDALEVFAEGKEGRKVAAPKWLRPRLLIYAIIWLALATIGISEFIGRSSFHVQILSTSSTPYFIDGDKVKNLFTLKVGNQMSTAQSFAVTLTSESAKYFSIESPAHLGPLEPGKEKVLPVLVATKPNISPSENLGRIEIQITSQPAGEVKVLSKPFIKPSVSGP